MEYGRRSKEKERKKATRKKGKDVGKSSTGMKKKKEKKCRAQRNTQSHRGTLRYNEASGNRCF